MGSVQLGSGQLSVGGLVGGSRPRSGDLFVDEPQYSAGPRVGWATSSACQLRSTGQPISGTPHVVVSPLTLVSTPANASIAPRLRRRSQGLLEVPHVAGGGVGIESVGVAHLVEYAQLGSGALLQAASDLLAPSRTGGLPGGPEMEGPVTTRRRERLRHLHPRSWTRRCGEGFRERVPLVLHQA